MKIGILTYHRTLNYGGCLQALATRLVLEDLGHEVYYVDYWPDYHKQMYSTFSWYIFHDLGFRKKIGYIRQFFKYRKYRKLRNQHFSDFLNTHIVPFCKPLSELYDVVIYGSDQIWRKQSALADYNPIYFGDSEVRANKKVAFSASMGELPDTTEDITKVKELLSNFDKIAVREDNLLNFIHDLGYKEAIQTLDPTLLVGSTMWDKVLPSPPYTGEPYILIYELWGNVFNMESIRSLAQKEKLHIKVLKGSASHYDTEREITTAGPDKFVQLIKNARYVFTSSFHGLAFSLIYKKEVFASFKSNGSRAKSLLQLAGIPDRYLESHQPLPAIVHGINYDEVYANLVSTVKQSEDYLKRI